MKILTLTDHLRHSSNNSLYEIVKALSRHNEVEFVKVATRNDKRNTEFFNGHNLEQIYAVTVDESFRFPADDLFKSSIPFLTSEFDVLFLRIPRPIDRRVLTSFADKFSDKILINHPAGIINTGSKDFLLSLEKNVVPMKLVGNMKDVEDFVSRYDVVLKPLENYGGKGIIRIINDKVETESETLEWNTFKTKEQNFNPPYLAMKYLKNVARGDKRIFVAGEKILTCAMRYPKPGGWLCNIAQGGSTELCGYTSEESEIVKYLSPILTKQGIFYYGLDTLENDDGQRIISEINTLSVGGIGPAEKISTEPLTDLFANLFVEYCKKYGSYAY